MRQTLVTPAASQPVTLTEAKAQCRVLHTDEDTFLTGLIAAATAHVEKQTGRAILPQTWRLTLERFEDEITLPQSPLRSVASVKYLDAAGAEQTLPSSFYVADTTSTPGRIVLAADKDWPVTADSPNAVVIEYEAGYAAAPAPIKHAILLLVGHWYANREAVVVGSINSDLRMAVDALLVNYRAYGFVA
jgi:uncharacterized phiE125 gp8 family phage protein